MSSAGDPAPSARVCVRPPLSASGPSSGSTFRPGHEGLTGSYEIVSVLADTDPLQAKMPFPASTDETKVALPPPVAIAPPALSAAGMGVDAPGLAPVWPELFPAMVTWAAVTAAFPVRKMPPPLPPAPPGNGATLVRSAPRPLLLPLIVVLVRLTGAPEVTSRPPPE